MDKKRLALLERAFTAEVEAGLSKGIHVIQTKAKLADVMVDEGLLAKRELKVSGVTIAGYELTHAGRMSYCMSCEAD